MAEWQTIDSAPKNGSTFLAWYPKMRVMELTWWTGTQWARFGGTAQPTMWHKKPEPPHA